MKIEITPQIKKEIKTISKGLLKILVFMLVLLLLLEMLSVFVFSKSNTVSFKNQLNKAYSFTLEPDNSLQVAAIGNSDLYSAYVPTRLWEEYGYTSTVISSPHQTTLQSYRFLEELCKKQSPKVLIIEIDMLYNSMVEGGRIRTSNMLDDYLFNYLEPDEFQNVIEEHFTVFTFHDRWKSIGKENKPYREDTPSSHGYKYSGEVNEVKVPNYMKKTKEVDPIPKSNITYLKQMLDFCYEKGMDVFLVECPTVTSWDYARHNAVVKLSNELGVEFIDLNMHVDDMDIELSTAFRDVGNHLNYENACKVTDFLGNYISKNYKLEDRRNDPAYKYWQDSVENFKEEMKFEDKKMNKKSDSK